MAGLGWLTRELAEVPPGEDWLSARERRALSTLSLPKRRAEWRLGRWTAKAAVAARLGAEVGLIEVLAEEDGSPAVLLEGTTAPLALSLPLKGTHHVSRSDGLATATAPHQKTDRSLALNQPAARSSRACSPDTSRWRIWQR